MTTQVTDENYPGIYLLACRAYQAMHEISHISALDVVTTWTGDKLDTAEAALREFPPEHYEALVGGSSDLYQELVESRSVQDPIAVMLDDMLTDILLPGEFTART